MPATGVRRSERHANGASAAVEIANRIARNPKSGNTATASCTGTNVYPQIAVTTTRAIRGVEPGRRIRGTYSARVVHRRGRRTVMRPGRAARPCDPALRPSERSNPSRTKGLTTRTVRPCTRTTRWGAPSATCGSPSPTGATSAASTACRSRCSGTSTASWIARSCSPSRSSSGSRARSQRTASRRSASPAASRSCDEISRRSSSGLAAIRGSDLTLTTNASLLARKAEALAAAGLDRVNVSLDRLDDAVFRAMNDVDFPVSRVLARDRGRRGGGPAREGQRGRQARGQRRRRSWTWHGTSAGRDTSSASSSTWTSGRRTAGDSTTSCRRRELVERIDAVFPLEPVEAAYRGEVAQRWRYRDGAGEVGLITSVTQPFCGDCTRARISAEGKLYTCLFAIARDRPARARPLGRRRHGARGGDPRGLGCPHGSLLGAPQRGDRRPASGSRCPTSAADRHQAYGSPDQRHLAGVVGRRLAAATA